MIHFLNLFFIDTIKYLGLLTLGLFSVILITENGAVLNADIIEKYQYYFLAVAIFVLMNRIIHFIRYKKFIMLPYSLSLYNRANNEEKDTKIFLDRFKKYDKRKKIIYFKNSLSIDKKMYLDLKDRIIHLLGYEDKKEIEIEIEAHKTKEVAIRTYELPTYFEWNTYYLKLEHIYLGHNKNGRYFLPLKDLTSTICCGESGAGKSNFLNMIIFSLLHNSDYIDKLDFIDLKGVELSRYKLKNTTFTDNIEETEILLENLKNEMNLRFQEMKEKGDLIYNGKYRICLIDEIGTISTHHNKKAKENIFNSLIEIAQKGRASKVILLIFSQKIDSTNIPTNTLTNLQASFLLKTSSNFNVNNTIGLQEEIEEITRTRVQDFPKGRMIYKDGLTSEKILLQTPYLSQDIQQVMIKHFQSWLNK